MKVMEKGPLPVLVKTSDFFVSPTFGAMSFSAVIGKITDYIESRPEFFYRIIVGSDSQINGQVDYVSALIVHRVGVGGIYFWSKTSRPRTRSLRERIYREALFSLELANRLVEAFRAQGLFGLNLEIHVDVGNNGETKEIVGEIIGMVRGSGFNVKTKPEAFGASKVADRHT